MMINEGDLIETTESLSQDQYQIAIVDDVHLEPSMAPSLAKSSLVRVGPGSRGVVTKVYDDGSYKYVQVFMMSSEFRHMFLNFGIGQMKVVL